MRQLFIVRHAQAETPTSSADHERHLTQQGQSEALALGTWLRYRGLCPKHALVSSSQRTRETFDYLTQSIAGAKDHQIELTIEPRLYNAEWETLLDVMHEVDDYVEQLLIIGHNPGISEYADMLAAPDGSLMRQHMAKGFSTADLAIIAFEGQSWHDIMPHSGRLRDFITSSQRNAADSQRI